MQKLQLKLHHFIKTYFLCKSKMSLGDNMSFIVVKCSNTARHCKLKFEILLKSFLAFNLFIILLKTLLLYFYLCTHYANRGDTLFILVTLLRCIPHVAGQAVGVQFENTRPPISAVFWRRCIKYLIARMEVEPTSYCLYFTLVTRLCPCPTTGLAFYTTR